MLLAVRIHIAGLYRYCVPGTVKDHLFSPNKRNDNIAYLSNRGDVMVFGHLIGEVAVLFTPFVHSGDTSNSL